MAEEQKWREPETHRLCANNCGFFGNPATLNLCSKCYKDQQQPTKSAIIPVEKTYAIPSPAFEFISSDSAITLDLAAGESTPEEMAAARPKRCAACRRRVGLTGFRCKCGTTFCGTHRYPEQHGCTFDFKAVGREAIAKSNPLVVAEKLDKI